MRNRNGPQALASAGREYRWVNFVFGLVFAVAMMALYYASGRSRMQSDNIGVLVIPWVAMFVYLPVGSFVAGTLQALVMRPRAVRFNTYFSNTQSLVAKALSFLGVVVVLVQLGSSGWHGVRSLFPTSFLQGHVTPNPSIERTFQRPLRALWPAAHVER